MKTLNIRYRSDEKLRDFIYENQIIDSSDILIQIFSSQSKIDNILSITNLLYELLPSASVIGSTTDGEIIDGRILTENIVISLTIFKHSHLKSALIETIDDCYEVGVKLAEKIVVDDTKVMIVFATSKNINAPRLLQGLKSIKEDIIICGTLSGDSGTFSGGSIFNHKKISKNGVIAVTINGAKLRALNKQTSQWEPVGREFKITKSKNNRIYTVDKMSVYELYKKYLGEEISTKLPLSGLQFPFVLKDSKNGSYIARSVLSSPGDGSLIYSAQMKEGCKIQIAFGDAQKMLENSQNIIKQTANEPIESIFIYASGGRRRFLQNIAYSEIESYKMLGVSVGFFGYGEFFSNSSESMFLNQSITCLLLSESDEIKQKEIRFKRDYKSIDNNLDTTRALTNIAKVSSRELQELNDKLESRVKEEVKRSRDKDSILIHNSKLAQMGEMMSLIAHQWRQPLSAISATSTGLQVKIELDKYNEKFFLSSLLKVEDYVKHLSDTIDDFTEFFKPSKKPEFTTLDKLCDKALFILSSSFSKNSILVTTNHQNNVELSTYPNEIIQVLINILKNAENILISREIKEPHIEINTFLKDQKYYIEVIDNGGGIDEKIIDKVFESYFTTKETENSTGLGLYMSKFIIEDSCYGKLEVENIKSGAKFTIIL